MDERNSPIDATTIEIFEVILDQLVFKNVLFYLATFFQFLTRWYIAPIWVAALGLALAQPLWYCIVMAIAFGFAGHIIWQ